MRILPPTHGQIPWESGSMAGLAMTSSGDICGQLPMLTTGSVSETRRKNFTVKVGPNTVSVIVSSLHDKA